ncbi:hypothetical protein PTKIN_Ptkin06aG0138700 [Pterospermum kingtungense]
MDEVGPSNQVERQGTSELRSDEVFGVRWRPRQLVFGPYSPRNEAERTLRVVVRRPLVARLTKDIIETYQICNLQFKYSEELNPKRFLTSPSVGVLNEGYDNVNSDLILTVNFVLINLETQRRYIVKDVLGHGTFGQVAKCWVPETNSFVAVKIIKNQPAYYQQACVEVSILTMLNKKYDPEDKHHIVCIYDYFVHQRHLCICFELLDTNLYELIKINHFRGLSLSIILRGLALLKDAGIIHCDLKPENILLCTSVKPAEIKLINFGSACMEDRTVYSYIQQSWYYRSPEVLLGCQYTTAIDMWSFGCIVAELFLGLPLFPGASEFDLLRRMIEILGEQPPDYVLKEAKNTSKFFKCIGSIHNIENGEASIGGRSAYQALSEEEYEARELKRPLIGKEYFNHKNLEAIVTNYPYRKNLPKEDIIKESQIRLALIDFLRGLVEFDPAKRWSPFQASKHPFVTGEPFTCPYRPPPETPRLPVAQNIKVDHHPGGGHWFAAGLSPNIPNRNRVAFHNSPHFPMVPYGHANSYGSIGSHGSYNDNTGLGSSYGSHGDSSNMCAYYSPVGPSAMNMHSQSGPSMLGSSPDKNWTENYALLVGMDLVQAEGSSQVVSGLPSHTLSNSYTANWKQQRGGIGMATGYSIIQNIPNSIGLGSNVQLQHSTEAGQDKSEASMPLPDPGDWDPNYSDELLLQEDGSDESCIAVDFSRGMHIGSADSSFGVGRFNHASTTNSNLSIQRLNAPIGFSHVEVGSPPSANDSHVGRPRYTKALSLHTTNGTKFSQLFGAAKCSAVQSREVHWCSGALGQSSGLKYSTSISGKKGLWKVA